MQVAGARVLLTGASGGIGNALAAAFAEAGAELVLSGRRETELKELSSKTGGRVVVADLAERDDVTRLLEEAGPVDIFLCNAALPAGGPLTDFTAVQVDRALEVNLRAPILMTHALIPGMVERGSGAVVLVSSLAGIVASKTTSLYNATKLGLRGFGLALREDLHGTGVGVTLLMPGFVSDAGMFADTGMNPPLGMGTKTPQQVAHAALNAVHRNKGEVLVAPRRSSALARFGGLAPGLVSTIARRGIGDDFNEGMVASQQDKR